MGRRKHLWAGCFGLLLGFSLSRMGFTDWAEVHRMFTFADLRLIATFIAGMALTMAAFAVLMRNRWLPARPLHRGSIIGGVLFGAGWALTGACPAVPLVQLGEGRLIALVTMAGVALGILLHRVVHRRWLRWDTDSCS